MWTTSWDARPSYAWNWGSSTGACRVTFQARRRYSTVAGLFFTKPAWHRGLGKVALLAGVGGCLLPAAANAQGEDCAALPAADQALCRLMVACAAINDADRREECFRVAARTVRDGTLDAAPEPSAAPAQAPSVAQDDPAPAVVEATPAPTASRAKETGQAPASSDSRKKRRWRERIASALRRDEGTVVEKKVSRTAFEIPRRFTATVTAIHRSGRNRRLVALDGKLLFESDRGGEGGLRLGDQVRVVQASRLYGKRYQITGPSRRPFVADRIRCEREDITIATRRQCRLLDD